MSSDRPHTPELSDYARGYRMSIEELQSLREQLAAAQGAITALREALTKIDALDSDCPGEQGHVDEGEMYNMEWCPQCIARAALRATESGEK